MSERFPGGFITKTPVVPSGPYETSSASGIWTLDQAMQYKKSGIWPTAGNVQPDPYFENVTMLLHGDGTNGAQNNTFLDSSTNNFTITRNGNTTQGSFSPYGSLWSNYFNGSSYFTVANNTAFDFGSGSFTIEAWVCPSSTSTTTIAYKGNSSTYAPFGLLVSAGSGVTFYGSTGGTTWDIVANNTESIPVGVWSHVAAVRNGSSFTVYINGVAGTSVTNSSPLVTNTQAVGLGATTDGSYAGAAYYSSLRIVKGTAVYTSNFTPSTTPLTAVSGTVLLTCQSNRFVDNSSNNFTLTVNGSPSVQRFSPFNPTSEYSTATIGGSGYFDGAGDSLSVASNSAFDFGSSDFTIEGWFNVGSTSSTPRVITYRNGSPTYAWYIGTDGTKLEAFVGYTTVYSANGAVRANTWYHFALERNGSNLEFYLNGTRVAQVSSTTSPSSSSDVLIGTDGTYPWTGYITNLRVVKGTAVYSGATYTVPTAPLTAVANTQLLCNMVNGAIFDNAMMNDLETVGNAQISTSVVKYGTGSISFDGANPWDYLVSQVSPNLGFGAGDFTIEGWGYVTSTGSTYQCMVSIGPPVQIYARSGTIEVYFNDSDDTSTYIVNGMTGPASSVSANTWFHFAVVRSGTTFTAYVNGVAGTPVTGVSAAVALSATPFMLGTYGPAPTTYPLTGYIDDFRITKGYARYTANFTPPTAAFPNF